MSSINTVRVTRGAETIAKRPTAAGKRRTRGKTRCRHERLVYHHGWPGNLLRCTTCGDWIAV